MALLEHLRLAAPTLRLTAALKRVRRRLRLRGLPRRAGHCPVCATRTSFVDTAPDNARESPMCVRCGSVPRQRALLLLLLELGIDLGRSRVHESSPSLATWAHFGSRCPSYFASYRLPDIPDGARVGAFRCVDLRDQRGIADGAFDLVITQDVLEHVTEPIDALREIQRTLAPDGHHVFTVPRTATQPTRTRARHTHGKLHHDLPPEYHRDPIARRGALVMTDWGSDLEAQLGAAGIDCTAHVITAPDRGVETGLEVFVTHRGA